MTPQPRITILFNEASHGATAVRRGDLEDACARAGLNAQILRVGHHDISAAAEREAAAADVLVAAGGDGTVSTIASVAVRGGLTFGVLPLGTLNHFARDARIPRKLEEALATIAAGHTRLFDVGDVNETIFLNNASIGMYPRLVWERQIEEAQGRGRWTAFGIALARSWQRYRTVEVRIIVDGTALTRETPFVFVGNGEYQAEGIALGRRPAVDAGRLSVFVAPDLGRFAALALPFRALLKRLPTDGRFESFLAREVVVETGKVAVSIALDGELMLARSPFCFRIRAGALRTLVPKD